MKNVAETEYICSCIAESMEGLFFLFVWYTPLKSNCQPREMFKDQKP